MLKRLPPHFYDITHPKRWTDTFSTPQGEERRVLTPFEMKERYMRNECYKAWLRSFKFMGSDLKGKQMKWQVVQILGRNHAQTSELDWWDDYRDAVFRVFVQPETRYSKYVRDHVQWYLLCPEDCELVARYEAKKKGITIPPRAALGGERWMSRYPEARRALLVPVECCRHFRHETTGGKLAEGL